MDSLKESVACMNLLDRLGILIFDEMSLQPSMYYNRSRDVIEGFQDLGDQRKTVFADHSLGRDIRKEWKQPLDYVFVESSMSATDLSKIL